MALRDTTPVTVMDDRAFWLEVRRGLITIARAVAKRYHCNGLLILLGVEN